MSKRRNLRRRAERARRCYFCRENDAHLRLYRERACCLSCYRIEIVAGQPRSVFSRGVVAGLLLSKWPEPVNYMNRGG